MRSPRIAAGGVLAALLACSPCSASPVPITLPEGVQGEAVSCVSEASQICPDVWTAQDHGLSCMAGKRERFSPRCRAVYDDVARALGQR